MSRFWKTNTIGAAGAVIFLVLIIGAPKQLEVLAQTSSTDFRRPNTVALFESGQSIRYRIATGGFPNHQSFSRDLLLRSGLFLDASNEQAKNLLGRYSGQIAQDQAVRTTVKSLLADPTLAKAFELFFSSHAANRRGALRRLQSTAGLLAVPNYDPTTLEIFIGSASGVFGEKILAHELFHYLFDRADIQLVETRSREIFEDEEELDHQAINFFEDRYRIVRALTQAGIGELVDDDLFSPLGKQRIEIARLVRSTNRAEQKQLVENPVYRSVFLNRGLTATSSLEQKRDFYQLRRFIELPIQLARKRVIFIESPTALNEPSVSLYEREGSGAHSPSSFSEVHIVARGFNSFGTAAIERGISSSRTLPSKLKQDLLIDLSLPPWTNKRLPRPRNPTRERLEAFVVQYTRDSSLGRETLISDAALEDLRFLSAYNSALLFEGFQLGVALLESNCKDKPKTLEEVLKHPLFRKHYAAFLKTLAGNLERDPSLAVGAAAKAALDLARDALLKECPKEEGSGDEGRSPNIGLWCPLTSEPVKPVEAAVTPQAKKIPPWPTDINLPAVTTFPGDFTRLFMGDSSEEVAARLSTRFIAREAAQCTLASEPVARLFAPIDGLVDSELGTLAAAYERAGGRILITGPDDEGSEQDDDQTIKIPSDLDDESKRQLLTSKLIADIVSVDVDPSAIGSIVAPFLTREALFKAVASLVWLTPFRLEELGFDELRIAREQLNIPGDRFSKELLSPELVNHMVNDAMGEALIAANQPKLQTFRLEPISCTRDEKLLPGLPIIVRFSLDPRRDEEDVDVSVREETGVDESEETLEISVSAKTLTARTMAVLLLRMRFSDDQRLSGAAEMLLTPLAKLVAGAVSLPEPQQLGLSPEQFQRVAALHTMNAAGLQQALRLEDYMVRKCPSTVRQRRGEVFADFWQRFADDLKDQSGAPIVQVAEAQMGKVIEELKDECELTVSVCEQPGQQKESAISLAHLRSLAYWPVIGNKPEELRHIDVRRPICSLTLFGPKAHPGLLCPAGEFCGVNGALDFDFSVFPELRELIIKDASNIQGLSTQTLASLNALERLELTDTKIDQAPLDLNLPNFKQKLREIVIDRAHPPKEFTLNGLQELIRVVVNESRTPVVSLANLPKLKAAWIQQSPTKKITLANLPQLRGFGVIRSLGAPPEITVTNVGTDLTGRVHDNGITVDLSQNTLASAAPVVGIMGGLGAASAKATFELAGTPLCTNANLESERRRLFKQLDAVNSARSEEQQGAIELKSCVRPSAVGCGDGVVQFDRGEDCDGDLAGYSCLDIFGVPGGTLKCTPACTFDTSGCPKEGGKLVYVCQPDVPAAVVSPSAEKSSATLAAPKLQSVQPRPPTPPPPPAPLPPPARPEFVSCGKQTTCIMSGKPFSTPSEADFRALLSVTTLNLRATSLTALPLGITTLMNLKVLDLSENDLTALPPEIRNLVNLETLVLTNNPRFKTLPPEIANLTRLKDLYAAGTKIAEERQRNATLLPRTLMHY